MKLEGIISISNEMIMRFSNWLHVLSIFKATFPLCYLLLRMCDIGIYTCSLHIMANSLSRKCQLFWLTCTVIFAIKHFTTYYHFLQFNIKHVIIL